MEKTLNDRYRVLPEYWDSWYGGLPTEEIGAAIVTFDEITRLSREWDVPVYELLKEVEEV